MKRKINSVLTWGFTTIPFFSSIFQTIIEKNILVFFSIYLGILLFLIIELIIFAFETGIEFVYIVPALYSILIPILAIKLDLFKIRLKQKRIRRLESKINRLNLKLNSLKKK